MVQTQGATWRAEYGEISEALQFRVGYLGQESWEAYFPIGQLNDLTSVLTAVQALGVGVLSLGTNVQARKVAAGAVTDVVIEPRSDTFPPQIMRLRLPELADLISTLQALALLLSGEPGDWDDSKPNPIPENQLPEYLAQAEIASSIAGVRNLSSAVLLGDSRTFYNGNYLQSQALSTAVTHDDRGYVACAMVLLRHRLDILKNGGVGGDTTAQMLARTDALLDLSPGWLIGMGCINSVNAGVSATTIISELTAIFDKCAAKGVRVVWGTDWISSGTDTAAKKQAASTVNEWLRRETSRRREFYLADYAAVMSVPATGLPVAAYASDGLHQDGPGGFIMAKELVKVLEPLLPPMDRLTSSNQDTTNILTNGMLEGNGGTGRATSWSWPGSGPAVFSKVARTDGYQGEWQQVVVTAGVASYLYQNVAAGGPWSEGDLLFFECEFETDATNWSVTSFYARLSLLGVSGTAPQYVADDMNHAGVPALGYRPERGVFRTPVLRVHEGSTHVSAGIYLIGTGTFRIARARIVKVN